MPTIPKITSITNASADVLNAIRNSASINYQNYVPIATPGAEGIKRVGAVIMDSPDLRNEFASSLINRIAKVLVTSKTYENPWAMFKKGLIEMGETVEEVFVNLATPFQYDPDVAESTFMKREKPDIRSAFHVMNYQKYYKDTIDFRTLRKAFLSENGLYDLTDKIVQSMVTGANYDEFLVMKYMVARHILDGQMKVVTIPEVLPANMKGIVSSIKGVSNDFTFMKDKYNLAGVKNRCEKEDQYIIVNSKFDASMDVEVLASAFNMSKAEFVGHRVLVDSFGDLDTERLAVLFKGDSTYQEISEDEARALDKIPAILVDKDWFMVYDNLVEMDEDHNGEGLYWQYWYHVWKTLSISPFANNALFVPATPKVTGVTVSPSEVTVSKGQTAQLSANVTAQDFASKAVVWTSNSENVTVSPSGLVTVDKKAVGTATITATSVETPTVTGTCTVTVQ